MDNELVRNLTNGNDQQRRSASYKMGKTRNPVYIPFLVAAYNDPDWSVKRNVIDSLKLIGTQEAIDFLGTIGQTVPTQSVLNQMSDEITYSPSRINNYKTIKTLASLFNIAAILAGALGALSLLSALGSYNPRYGFSTEVFIYGFFFSAGIASALIFAFLSESINIILDIEANSRQTAKTLERILRSQNPD